ncbi:MAG: hypothetical protein QM775_31385 [Pirellulales bacterium]
MPRLVRFLSAPAYRAALLLVPLVCSSLAGFASAGEKILLQLSDIYRQEAITDFKVSPRGDEAVYVRSWYDQSQPGRRSAIWRS